MSVETSDDTTSTESINLAASPESINVAGSTEAINATITEAQRTLPSLSPSRAADFKTCPLLYRFRTIDRIPEPPTPDQARGTLVHAVLERLFDFPAGDRTQDTAAGLVQPQWDRLRAEQPLLEQMFGAEGTPSEFLESATGLLGGYFS